MASSFSRSATTDAARPSDETVRPLSGIRVVDLTRVVSGPFATMQLGDLGAEIIKIEEPKAGDDSRAFGPPFANGESVYFMSVNRNKRSCAIDLKSAAGREILLQLAESADVIVENFRPGTMEKLGLGKALLQQRNPRLIYCSISGFGTTGPDAQRPGYDLILQGEAGIMDITGDPDGQPTKVGTSIGDMIAGLYAVQGILAAIVERQTSGMARDVHVSMLDALASLLTFNAGIYFATGESPTRRGNEHPTIAPYETFKASDGWLNLGVANDKFWRLFCDITGATALYEDDRFATAPLRVTHRNALKPLVSKLLATQTRAYWVDRLSQAGVPCGLIRKIGEVCEAPQLLERGMVLTMDHPVAGSLKNIAGPLRFNDKAPGAAMPPPILGQHTKDILDALGISPEQYDTLVRSGVVKAAHLPSSLQPAMGVPA